MEFLEFDQGMLDEASDLLRAVTHDLRLSIISLLDEQGEINVNTIYTSLKLEQSITSQHLKILRDSNIVNTRRDGKLIYYSLNYDKLATIQKAVTSFDQVSRERQKNKKRVAESA